MDSQLNSEVAGLEAQALADGLELVQLNSSGAFDKFIESESQYYHSHIRTNETRENYELHYSFIAPIVREYGVKLKSIVMGTCDTVDVTEPSICFFLPHLDNDFIHVELLTNILDKLSRPSNFKLYVAGFSRSQTQIGSRRLAQLSDSHKVGLYMLRESHTDVVQFLNWLQSKSVNLLISYSIPRLLPAFIEVLGPSRVAWMPTKFELNSFVSLKLLISGFGKRFACDKFTDKTVYRIPGTLPKNYLFYYSVRSGPAVKLITINREEKIKSGEYLDSIARVLKGGEYLHFYWTGRHWDASIRAHFQSEGLSDKHTHVGWLNHKLALPDYHIFADTFGLSGTIAAAAFASGMPTLFMRGSQSWLEAAEQEILSSRDERHTPWLSYIDLCLAKSAQDYVFKLESLIEKVRAGQFDGQWQMRLAESYFTNSDQEAAQFEAVLTDILEMQNTPTI